MTDTVFVPCGVLMTWSYSNGSSSMPEPVIWMGGTSWGERPYSLLPAMEA